MRPMTAREALQIERSPRAHAEELDQAGRILDALVEWREAESAYRYTLSTDNANRAIRAERKLASLERGEEPQGGAHG